MFTEALVEATSWPDIQANPALDNSSHTRYHKKQLALTISY